MEARRRALLSAGAFYLLWVAATWFFEGRIRTLLRPEAAGARITYALAVNLLFGIVGGIALIRFWLKHGLRSAALFGFPNMQRTVVSVLAGLTLGLAFYFLQGAPSLNPTVIVNAYAQVFVVSAAEIVVCWAVVGNALAPNLSARRSVLALIKTSIVTSILFGVYHFGHSAPFNTVPMVAFLTLIGLGTSAFFFISRDLIGTAVFHNFLGTFGVVQALVAARALHSMEVVQVPLVVTAAITILVLAGGYIAVRRPATTA